MRILVVGNSGFIGSHLSERLASAGHEVVGLDLRQPAQRFGLTRFVQGDIRLRHEILPALEGVEAVIHLAAVHKDRGHAEAEYWDTNENGTRQLLQTLSEHGSRDCCTRVRLPCTGLCGKKSTKTRPRLR